MKCTDKIKAIEEVFRQFHNPTEWERELDTIDVCIAIEEILKK